MSCSKMLHTEDPLQKGALLLNQLRHNSQEGVQLRGVSGEVSVEKVMALLPNCLFPKEQHMVSNTVNGSKDMVFFYTPQDGMSINAACKNVWEKLGGLVTEVKTITLKATERKEGKVVMIQAHCPSCRTAWNDKDTEKAVGLFEDCSGMGKVGPDDFQLGISKKGKRTHILTIYVNMSSRSSAVDKANPYNPCMDAVECKLASGETVYLSTVQTSPKNDFFLHENNVSARSPQVSDDRLVSAPPQVKAVPAQIEAVPTQVVPHYTWRWNPYSAAGYNYWY
eukprot:TRINITY_DN15740_c0_g1_i1.p1 TRINITY_DN15740_c0_g1~~TRINITY_DN15740_c0_g1_i1.p1  ORF type:complete len:296 (+),score=75.07 TRINITY_DN15740_c0_g1_i1:50-889(+)